jgi:SAM-dependent methyltransferase
VATDASAQQIAAATPREGVTYRVARADSSGLGASSVDLVTVAQAIHWFDREAFYGEARRVLIAGGVVAAWCYNLPAITPAVDAVVRRFYEDTVGPYWPPERRLVDEEYRTIDFPFDEFSLPPLAIELSLSLDQLAGYVRTWSATQRYVEARGHDPVTALAAEIQPLWGEPSAARATRWRLAIRAGFARG